jgi:hypothetical protein
MITSLHAIAPERSDAIATKSVRADARRVVALSLVIVTSGEGS